jgi:prefoldin alpha subunit
MSGETSDEERLNSLVVEVRVLEGTYNELSARQNFLERILVESRAALDAIKGLSEYKPDEVLLQIGGGALVRSSPPSIDRVLVGVGANVVLEKSRDEATAMLESRVKEIENSIVTLLGQRNQIAERIEADRQLMQAILNRQAQKG